MRAARRCVWLAVGGGAAALAAQAPAPAPVAAPAAVPIEVAVRLPKASAFAGERLRVVVEVATDAAFLAERAVPLLQARFDRPFQLLVPWLGSGPAGRATPVAPPAGAPTARLPVGAEALWLQVLPADERGRDRLQLEVLLDLSAGPATVDLGGVRVRGAFASRFADHLLAGRQPLDRQEFAVAAAPLPPLPVQPLPQPAPPGFAGAVGRWQAEWAPAAPGAAVGRTLEMLWTLRGDGDPAALPTPAWPGWRGAVVQGLRERAVPGARAFAFDVLPLRAGELVLPAPPLWSFDPAAAAYVAVAAPPAVLAVAPWPADQPEPPQLRELRAADAAAAAAAARWPWWVPALAAAAALAAGLGLRARRRTRARAAARAALAAAAAAAAGGPPDAAAAAFAALLADCGVPPAAGDVAAALRAAGVAAALAERAAALAAALAAARYGGPPPPATEVAAVAGALAGGAAAG